LQSNELIDLLPFGPIATLCEKNNPPNIRHMPVVIFFVCLGVFAYLISNQIA